MLRWVVALVAVVGVAGWGLSTLDPSGEEPRVSISALPSGTSTEADGHAGSPTSLDGSWPPLCDAAAADYPQLLAVAAGTVPEAALTPFDALSLLRLAYPRQLLVDVPSASWDDLSAAIDGVDDVADGSITDEAMITAISAYRRFSEVVLPTC